MQNFTKALCTSVLLPLVTLAGGFSLSPGYNRQPANNALTRSTPDTIEPRDLSGSYKGRVTVSDASKNNYLMTGPATLQIVGERFTLTKWLGKKRGKELTGVIKAKWIVEPSLSVGSVKLDNEPNEMEIRWFRKGNILKLVRAAGANRVFRFCSAGITKPQCLAEAEF